jgi:hypothetical protein
MVTGFVREHGILPSAPDQRRCRKYGLRFGVPENERWKGSMVAEQSTVVSNSFGPSMHEGGNGCLPHVPASLPAHLADAVPKRRMIEQDGNSSD